jgi:uncharacterized protein YutE (UPF0331/DUF86 family)
MTPSTAFRERLVLERLKETYEQKGYEFFSEPTDDLLPPFLRGYRPDAIALKPHEGVVIEVKFGNHPGRDRRLESVAALLAEQTGWHLKIYVEQPRAEETLSIDAPTPDQIEAWIGESERLAMEGHERAAFLLAWSVLEAIARVRASEQGIVPLRLVSPAGAVQSLEMSGYIDEQAGQDFRNMVNLRNRIVHGDLAAEVGRSAVEGLIHRLRELTPSKAVERQGHAAR